MFIRPAAPHCLSYNTCFLYPKLSDDSSYQNKGQADPSSPRNHHVRRSSGEKLRDSRQEDIPKTPTSDPNRNNNHNRNRYNSSKDRVSSGKSSDFRSESHRTSGNAPVVAQASHRQPGQAVIQSQDETRQSRGESKAARPPSGLKSREGIPMSPRLCSPRRASVERRPSSGLSRSESMKESRPSSGGRSHKDSSERSRRSLGRLSRSESVREQRPSSGQSSNSTDRPTSGKLENSTNRPSSSGKPPQLNSQSDQMKKQAAPKADKHVNKKKESKIGKVRKDDAQSAKGRPLSGSKQAKEGDKKQKRKADHKKDCSQDSDPSGATNGIRTEVTVRVDEPGERGPADTKPPGTNLGRLAAEEAAFRSHSPYLSDEETCMMREISKMTL